MKKLLALLMIWLLLPIAGAEEAYTMQDGSLILMDGAGRKCQPIAMKPDFPEALLADADISGAIQLNLPETLLPYVSDELTGGETLVELYCTTELIAMHTVDAAGWRRAARGVQDESGKLCHPQGDWRAVLLRPISRQRGVHPPVRR